MSEIQLSETRLREQICRFGRSLFERGLTPGSSGNISLRLDDGGWLVTPTNASLGFLDPATITRLDAKGALVSGHAPTKEIPLHAALYESRAEARAIVHLHSTHAVAVSMLPEIDPRAVLPPLTPYYLMRAGATALVPYYRPGDPAVADAIRGSPAATPRCCWPITVPWWPAPPWRTPSSPRRNWRRRPSSTFSCATSTRAT